MASERIPLTIYSICVYFCESCRPPLVDFSFTLDGREHFATAASSSYARLNSFDHEMFDREIQIDAEGRYRVYLPVEEIGVLEVVDAARMILERFYDRRMRLNDFEVVDPPSEREVRAAYKHWSRLARS